MLRKYDRDLLILDPEKISISARVPMMYDQSIWNVYLPRSYQLSLATRSIAHSEDVLSEPRATATVGRGIHKIELLTRPVDNGWATCILVDDLEVIRVIEPKAWNMSRSSSGGSRFSIQQDLDPKTPVILFKRSFSPLIEEYHSDFPPMPRNGQQLWLEQIEFQPKEN